MAEAGDRAIDQARVERLQARIVEPVFGEAAGLEILDHDIGLGGHAPDDLAPLGTLEIERERALAAIAGMEVGGVEPFAVLARQKGRAPSARIVAGAGALDLDDVGSQIGQRLAGPGPGQDAGQFQHFQPGERFQRSLLENANARRPSPSTMSALAQLPPGGQAAARLTVGKLWREFRNFMHIGPARPCAASLLMISCTRERGLDSMELVDFPLERRVLEWPTLALATLIYGMWFAATFLASRLAVLGADDRSAAWTVAWQMSLQHEVIHGHPDAVQTLSTISIGSWPLALWLPYRGSTATPICSITMTRA